MSKHQRDRGLTGKYHVLPTPTAMGQAMKLTKGDLRDYFRLKRVGVKLRYFPERPPDALSFDMDVSKITGAGKPDIFELRIDEEIAGNDNLRLIFFPVKTVLVGDRIPRLWILSALQKKTKRFSRNQLTTFQFQRQLIITRHYEATSVSI